MGREHRCALSRRRCRSARQYPRGYLVRDYRAAEHPHQLEGKLLGGTGGASRNQIAVGHEPPVEWLDRKSVGSAGIAAKRTACKKPPTAENNRRCGAYRPYELFFPEHVRHQGFQFGRSGEIFAPLPAAGQNNHIGKASLEHVGKGPVALNRNLMGRNGDTAPNADNCDRHPGPAKIINRSYGLHILETVC